MHPHRTRFALLLLTASLYPAEAFSAETATPQLLLAGGGVVQGSVATLVDGKLTLEPDNKTYAAAEWTRWAHPRPIALRPHLYFGASSVLVAKQAWTGKVPIAIDDRQVVLTNQALGKVALDRQQVRLVVIAAADEPDTTRKLLHESNSAANRDTDLVWLVEGDLLSGQIKGFDGITLELELAGEVVPLPASRVAACCFAGHQPPQAGAHAEYLVGFDDGTLLEGDNLRVGTGGIEFAHPRAGKLRASSPKLFAFVQNQTPGITYLSDLETLDYKHTPYFNQELPLARDRNLSGKAAKVGNNRYAKCLAMHSAARAVYTVPQDAQQFCAELAIDATAQRRGSVVFRVYLAGESGLENAYESPVVRGGDKPISLTVDIVQSRALVLVVDYADRGDELDRALWLDARFVP